MVKTKRGLPEGFDLNINANSPAILGDFLDEAPPAAEAANPPQTAAPVRERVRVESAPVGMAQRKEVSALVQPVPEHVALRRERTAEARLSSYPKPPRMELSLNHETKRMVQELLDYVQQMGPQPPAKASEMFQGIISVLHRAKGMLDLTAMPRRGQWGSPTAKAFPVALGQAFGKAIAELYWHENPSAERPQL